jgi:stringent starvation protein B
VKVDEQTKVPTAYVKNGEIVLNLSSSATHKLTMDNNWIQFNARFGGVSHEIAVPMHAVTGIFAKETGYGLAFKPGQPGDPAGSAVEVRRRQREVRQQDTSEASDRQVVVHRSISIQNG